MSAPTPTKLTARHILARWERVAPTLPRGQAGGLTCWLAMLYAADKAEGITAAALAESLRLSEMQARNYVRVLKRGGLLEFQAWGRRAGASCGRRPAFYRATPLLFSTLGVKEVAP